MATSETGRVARMRLVSAAEGPGADGAARPFEPPEEQAVREQLRANLDREP